MRPMGGHQGSQEVNCVEQQNNNSGWIECLRQLRRQTFSINIVQVHTSIANTRKNNATKIVDSRFLHSSHQKMTENASFSRD